VLQQTVNAAGTITSACCDNHMKCTQCVDKMQDILNLQQMVYTVTTVFLNEVRSCALCLKGTNIAPNYILLSIKVGSLATNKTQKI
jgi:hypothetical protein